MYGFLYKKRTASPHLAIYCSAKIRESCFVSSHALSNAAHLISILFLFLLQKNDRHNDDQCSHQRDDQGYHRGIVAGLRIDAHTV